MTRRTNARIAGFTFLFYIVVGITSLVVFGRAAGGTGIAEKMAGVSAHATSVRITVVLGLFQSFSALVLAVTLYAITRDEDKDLAMLGFVCRLGEGLVGVAVPTELGLLWLGRPGVANVPDPAAAHAIGAFLLQWAGWTSLSSATFFAVGSTFFSLLFLRGRMIPATLARLGVGASVLLVVLLPLQLAGFVSGPITSFMWLPMLAFEVPLALWLIVKGGAPGARGQST